MILLNKFSGYAHSFCHLSPKGQLSITPKFMSLMLYLVVNTPTLMSMYFLPAPFLLLISYHFVWIMIPKPRRVYRPRNRFIHIRPMICVNDKSWDVTQLVDFHKWNRRASKPDKAFKNILPKNCNQTRKLKVFKVFKLWYSFGATWFFLFKIFFLVKSVLRFFESKFCFNTIILAGAIELHLPHNLILILLVVYHEI